MTQFTRRITKYRKNRSYKKGGSTIPYDERKGIFDIASDKLSAFSSSIVNKAEDLGLNALGLEKIGQHKQNQDIGTNLDKYIDKNKVTNAVSDVKNAVEQTSANVVDNVNEVLASDAVNNSVQDAAKTTAEISGKLAEHFNDAMNDPIVKEQLEEAIEHAGELGEIIVKSSEEPLKEVVKIGVETGTDAIGAASAGIVKVGTDMMAAVPGVGALIEFGKILNDSSKAASAVVESGSKTISAASDAFATTTENIRKGLRELEEKKKIAQQISNRTTRSINHFENPLPPVQNGGRKTKRRFFKRSKSKPKTKSVRFSM